MAYDGLLVMQELVIGQWWNDTVDSFGFNFGAETRAAVV